MIVSTKYLIVGNSAGGIAAAEAIREIDMDGTLAIISDEKYPAYSKVAISKYLAGEKDFNKIMLRTPDFYSKNNINFLPGKKVVSIVPQDKFIQLEDGNRINYEKMLIATGGKPIVPRIDGIEKSGIFTFNKLDDVKDINRLLDGHKEAVVIGGGLIGISVTEGLYKRGIHVTIIELKNRILSTILDEHASEHVYRKITESGIKIITGCTVRKIEGTDKVERIVLDNNSEIPCQLLIMAIGVNPRIEILQGTGIKTNRGIIVDRHMRTSNADIYACGDVAEAYDFVNKDNRVIPIWPGASNSGRIAGQNMAGNNIEYSGITSMNTFSYFGMNIASAGIIVPPDDTYQVVIKETKSDYQKLILKDNCIVGMVFIGKLEKAAIILNLIKQELNVRDCHELLISEDAYGLIRLRTQKQFQHYST